jgi:hypothetical protein
MKSDETLLRVKGQEDNFKCECGCQTFIKLIDDRFMCRDCNSVYEVEE